MRIFFGGPLTDLKEKEKTKVFYRRMADVAEKNGYEWFWAFLNGTDPVKNPEVPSEVVYETDLAELKKSDLMIVYLGEPTTGTGQEIEYAKEHNIPVYLLFEQGKQITRMVLGSPNIKEEIEFTSESDALTRLDDLLKRLKNQQHTSHFSLS